MLGQSYRHELSRITPLPDLDGGPLCVCVLGAGFKVLLWVLRVLVLVLPLLLLVMLVLW